MHACCLRAGLEVPATGSAGQRGVRSMARTLGAFAAAFVLLLAGPNAEAQDQVQGAAAVRAAASTKPLIRVIAAVRAPQAATGVQTPEAAAAKSRIAASMLAANALRVEPIHDMPFIVLEVSSAELQRLIESGDVAAVQEDIPEKAVLAQSGPLVRAPDAWARGARGAGRAVAILDTGVDASHPFLAGRVTAEACFSTSSPSQGSTTVCPDGSNQQVGPGAGRRAA
ncbi:MAG: peptidase and in kexin sedolisin [Microvirga sp.]|jgi:subtilisin family serine protease|nr:peptidase and in kexin sedolisin [Microvirga sp.]